MPRMLRGIVEGLVSAEPDLEIVGDFEDAEAAVGSIEATGASVVIAGLQAPSLARRLSDRVRVVGVSADGRESVLYELRPHERVLGEISPSTLLAAIRGGQLSEWTDAQRR
jgi:DNA-binding NarL/FixJ family response regulator